MRAHSKQPGPGSLQKVLILTCGCCPHRKGSLYTRRTSPEPQAVEGVPDRAPRPHDQPAQHLLAGPPLPLLRVLRGMTKPAPLAGGISSRCRELQVANGMAGTPRVLRTGKHRCEWLGGGHPRDRRRQRGWGGVARNLGSMAWSGPQTHTAPSLGRASSVKWWLGALHSDPEGPSAHRGLGTGGLASRATVRHGLGSSALCLKAHTCPRSAPVPALQGHLHSGHSGSDGHGHAVLVCWPLCYLPRGAVYQGRAGSTSQL